MPTLPKEWENNDLVKYFMRHVVPIYFDLRKGSERHQLIYTAFVFSVCDCWLLMTAGHGITKMKDYRAHGYELVNCSLLDSLGAGATHRHPLPFDYDGAEPLMLGLDPSWDYGVLSPADNTRRLLEANGVVALTEKSWDAGLHEIETYRVLGIPEELTEPTSPNNMTVTMTFPRLERVNERPEGFVETSAQMFYGRLPSDPRFKLKGMSGGPIFAFAHVDGNVRYWLHAMQVSWLKGTRYISGMLMRPLGEYLREVAEGKHGEAPT
jgi:hypothetical protein